MAGCSPTPTKREKEAFDLVAAGHSYEGAGKKMGISFQRVHVLLKSYHSRSSIFVKRGNQPLAAIRGFSNV